MWLFDEKYLLYLLNHRRIINNSMFFFAKDKIEHSTFSMGEECEFNF